MSTVISRNACKIIPTRLLCRVVCTPFSCHSLPLWWHNSRILFIMPCAPPPRPPKAPPPQLWSCVSSGSCISPPSFFLYSRPLRLFIARWDDRKRKRHSITDMPLVQKFCQKSLFVPSWRGYEEAAIPPSFPDSVCPFSSPPTSLSPSFILFVGGALVFRNVRPNICGPSVFVGGVILCIYTYIYVHSHMYIYVYMRADGKEGWNLCSLCFSC